MKCPKCSAGLALHTPDRINQVHFCCDFHCDEEIFIGGVMFYRVGYWTCEEIHKTVIEGYSWLFRLRHSWTCACGFEWDEIEPKHQYLTEESK